MPTDDIERHNACVALLEECRRMFQALSAKMPVNEQRGFETALAILQRTLSGGTTAFDLGQLQLALKQLGRGAPARPFGKVTSLAVGLVKSTALEITGLPIYPEPLQDADSIYAMVTWAGDTLAREAAVIVSQWRLGRRGRYFQHDDESDALKQQLLQREDSLMREQIFARDLVERGRRATREGTRLPADGNLVPEAPPPTLIEFIPTL